MEARKTLAEQLVENVVKIRETLEELSKSGISEELLILYVQQKTKLNKRDIRAVLEAVKSFSREMLAPAKEEER
ncbi:hypothetical protein DRP04_05865 [Archaeoglobales archaeon]|nr:MAG: hypothetical protein DRP04_05865 [Archaeoglobales archaeon]